jgi:hypothetical protein
LFGERGVGSNYGRAAQLCLRVSFDGSTRKTRDANPSARPMKSDLERTDYSVVVKNRARMPKPWRWEIYRAGRISPIAHSDTYFESRSTANLEGKVALEEMLKKMVFSNP